MMDNSRLENTRSCRQLTFNDDKPEPNILTRALKAEEIMSGEHCITKFQTDT